MANLPGNNYTPPPLQPFKKYEPPQRSRFIDTPLGFGVDAGLNLGAKFLDYWFTGKAQERTARLSDKYQQLAEARADKRNRELMLDQPFLSAEGRRKAGLNPYGDAVLPGMSGASNIATDAPAMPSFLDSQRLTLDGYVALKQLENDTIVAKSQAKKNDAEALATIGGETRAKERFPVELYGLKLANDLNTFNYEQAKDKAPLILKQLENDIDYQEWEIYNASKDADIKEQTIEEKKQNVLNLQATRGLIKAQEILAYSNVSLNTAQIELFNAQEGLVNAQKQYTRLECKDLYETLINNLKSGYYASLSKANVQRLEYELERLRRTLWDKPDDSSIWWYAGNTLWNIQNCLTLSGSASASSGSRVVTKK